MALVSTATNVSDQDATPVTKVNQLKKGGVVRTAQGYIAAASFTGGTVGQWYTFVRVPVRARILGVYLTNPTTTTGAVKCGLYRTNGGIAIDDDCFSTVTVLGAENNRASIETVRTPSARKDSIATAHATIISTAGAQSDVEVDVALTIVTVIGTPQDAVLEVDYVLPE